MHPRHSQSPVFDRRRRTLTRTLTLLVPLALAGCAASAPPPDLAQEAAAVTAVSGQWLQMEQAKDAAGIAALFIPEGTLFRERREPVSGTAAIQAYLTAQYQANPRMVTEWKTEHVDVAASGDMATEYGNWTDRSTGPTGAGQDHGRYVTSYRKVGGAWKVVSDISLSTTPVPTAPAVPAAPAPQM
jgi:uncharacterized protein (TIGR02246 family)